MGYVILGYFAFFVRNKLFILIFYCSSSRDGAFDRKLYEKKLFKEIITPLDFNSSLMRRMKLVKLARLLLISRTFIFSRATKQHITQNIYFLHKGKFQCTADRQPDYFGFNWGGESDVNLIIPKLLIPNQSNQGTFIVGGRITVQLVSSLTRLDLTNKENMLFFVYVPNEAA